MKRVQLQIGDEEIQKLTLRHFKKDWPHIFQGVRDNRASVKIVYNLRGMFPSWEELKIYTTQVKIQYKDYFLPDPKGPWSVATTLCRAVGQEELVVVINPQSNGSS